MYFYVFIHLIEKDEENDRYVLEPTDASKQISSSIYGDAGDMADPEFRLSVKR